MNNRVRLIGAALIALVPSARVSAQDTLVVRADNAPEWGSNTRLVRELRIGELDGAPEYTFGRIRGVTAGRDGSIFVVDAQVPTVRQYDAAGKHVRNFGRRGNGPGELQNPETAALVGNQLIVRDLITHRFVVYPLDGGEPRHWNYQSSSASFRPIVVHEDGAISTPFSIPRGGPVGQQAVLRYNRDGAIRDSLITPKFGPDPAMLTVAAGPGGGRASYSIAYLPGAVWVFSPKGQFMGGLPSRYSVVIVDGRNVKRIDRRSQPVSVSAEERNELMSRTERIIRSGNDPNFKWNGPEVPTTKPFYKELRVDSEDRIWVHLHSRSTRVEPANAESPVTYREPVIYDVISSAGRYLGQIRFPDGFVLHHVQGNQVWGTERGEFDVQYVVRYRIAH